jgi:xanthine dehydrogenase accessory factor
MSTSEYTRSTAMKEIEALYHPEELYQEIMECFSRRESAVLVTVITRSSSGPRDAGASMLVSMRCRTMGTVGGGLLESRTKEIAIQVLGDHRPVCRIVSLEEKEPGNGGMICGGEMEVLAEFLDAEDLVYPRIFARIIENQEKGRPAWLVRSIRITEEEESVQTGIGLIDNEGFDPGSIDLSRITLDQLQEERRKEESVLIPRGGIRYFIQPSGVSETVFIFGAGHIARELAPICSTVGFRTVVIDDRPEFANAVRFPLAAQTLVTDSYKNCFGDLAVSASSFIVIVTRAHAHDLNVLCHALKTPARYIGMIASRRKREFIYESLRKEGFPETDLARVHCPIGLGIGAQTPAEIAVSISAELIAVRTGTIQ